MANKTKEQKALEALLIELVSPKNGPVYAAIDLLANDPAFSRLKVFFDSLKDEHASEESQRATDHLLTGNGN